MHAEGDIALELLVRENHFRLERRCLRENKGWASEHGGGVIASESAPPPSSSTFDGRLLQQRPQSPGGRMEAL